MTIDTHYWSIAALLHGNGTNGSTTFTDDGPNPKTPSVVGGSAQISTASPKFGTGSILLASGTSDYLQYASHADFDFGLLDFTIEFWWKPVSASVDYSLIGLGTATAAANSDTAFGIFHYGATLSGKLRAFVNNGATVYSIDSVSALSAGVWYHIAFTRVSGVLRLFIDGVQQGTFTTANVSINAPASRVLRIGKYTDGTPRYANGSFDDIRINKGVGRYSATFAPPTEEFGTGESITSNFSITMPLPTTTMNTGGTYAAVMPMPTVGIRFANTIAAVMPMPTVGFRLGNGINAAMPMATVRMTGGNSVLNTITAAMPMAQVAMRLGDSVRAAMPMPAVRMEGTSTILVKINATMPMPTVAMTVTKTESASVTASMPRPQVAMRGGMRVSAVMPMAQVLVTGTAEGRLSITAVMPMAQVSCTISKDNTVSIEAEMPMLVAGPWGHIRAVMPMARVDMVLNTVVVITYEAYAINLKPGNKAGVHEVTRYTGMPFTGIVRWRGDYYGWGPGGLYLIGGDTDDGAAISWAWNTGITNFGSRQMKAVRETFIHGRLGPSATAKVSIGEAADVSYAAVIERGRNAQAHRIKYGRGLKAEYWSFGLSDATGSAMEVDSMQHEPKPLSRKI